MKITSKKDGYGTVARLPNKQRNLHPQYLRIIGGEGHIKAWHQHGDKQGDIPDSLEKPADRGSWILSSIAVKKSLNMAGREAHTPLSPSILQSFLGKYSIQRGQGVRLA